MIYCDYDFYTNEYLLGRSVLISATDFTFYANKASKLIDKATFDKARTSWIEAPSEPSIRATLGCCCCELAECCYNEETTKAQPQSEKVGDYSISYHVYNSEDSQRKQHAIIRTHLSGTGLLYCGVSN